MDVHQAGNVELGGVPGALGVADVFSIDPNMKGRVDALKSQAQLVMLKRRRNGESTDIRTGLVMVVRHIRGIYWKGIDDIRVLGAPSIALQLPHARNLDGWPAGGIIGREMEAGRRFEWAPRAMKAPCACERMHSRFRDVAGEGVGLGEIGLEGCPRRQRVQVDDGRVVPAWTGGGECAVVCHDPGLSHSRYKGGESRGRTSLIRVFNHACRRHEGTNRTNRTNRMLHLRLRC